MTPISFEKILCPTDLSTGSNEVFRYGAALARAFNAKLLACHFTDATHLASPASRCQLKKRLIDSVNEHIRIPDSFKLDWEALILEGEPATTIPCEAERWLADLIILNSRRRPVGAALLGSTAEAVCRTAPCPVLVTHSHEHDWAGETTNDIDLERILVACDFSPDSQQALSYGLSFARKYQAELHLIHVLSQSQFNTAEMALLPADTESQLAEITDKLQSIVANETHLWGTVKQAVRIGAAGKEILDYAKTNDIDLICLGVKGTGSRIQKMLGSTVDYVLRHAPCPVLTVHPATE